MEHNPNTLRGGPPEGFHRRRAGPAALVLPFRRTAPVSVKLAIAFTGATDRDGKFAFVELLHLKAYD
jgi:hypothetical protein